MNVGLVTEPTGAHLGHYLGSLRQTSEVEAVHIVDPTGQMAAQMKEALGGKLASVSQDAKSLAKLGLRLVIVTVEAHHAPDLIADCLEGGSHVLAEKPACVRVQDFERLADLARSKDRQLLLALANRMSPLYRDACRLVAEGKLGRVYGVQCYIVADQARVQRQRETRTWLFVKEKAGGGHLSWLGIHAIDWIQFICGTSIAELSAYAGNVGGAPVDVEDAAVISFRCQNGMFGTLTSAYYLEKGGQILTTIWGEKGWMWLTPKNENCLVWQTHADGAAGQPQEIKYDAKPDVYQFLVEATVRAAAGDGPFPLTTEDSLQAIRVVFAAYESAHTGQRVSLPPR
jgi:predicted dehydrogenase